MTEVKEQVKHTPIPWGSEIHVKKHPFNRVLRGTWKKEGDGTYLAYLNCSEEDEEFLLLAVNSHQNLLDACREALTFIQRNSEGISLDVKYSLRFAIKSAISQSEEK